MWPFRRTNRKLVDWWTPEYSELSNYNALRMRASGAQYRTDATETDRAEARRQAQEELRRLPLSYVDRMARLQADYNVAVRR